MARLILLGIILVLLVLIARAIFPKKNSSTDKQPTEMVMDPNNQVYIPKSDAFKKTINGKEYYFSSEQSAEEFIKKQKTI